MVSANEISRLLAPFGLQLNSSQLDQVKTYLELLLRWNEKINLTSICTPEECVTRHFGESLLLAVHERLSGDLLDVGSGAGFPGLALKIVFPDLHTTLLEPVAKKRAFLKEVCRTCSFSDVEVRPERLEDWAGSGRMYDAITARALGKIEQWVEEASQIIRELGKIHLWVSQQQSKSLRNHDLSIGWIREIEIPTSMQTIILTGVKNDLDRKR